MNTATYTVKITDPCDEGQIEIPNIISPNGDGFNDEFYVRFTGINTVSSIRIFNRWGEMVFETIDPNGRWDGTFRGQSCNPGVYAYYVKVICSELKTSVISGNITLLK